MKKGYFCRFPTAGHRAVNWVSRRFLWTRRKPRRKTHPYSRERTKKNRRWGREERERGKENEKKTAPHQIYNHMRTGPVHMNRTGLIPLQGPTPQLLRKPISILFHSAPPVMLLTPPCIYIFVSLSFISSCIFFTALFFRRIPFYFCVCISYLAQHIYFISFFLFILSFAL